MLKGHLAGSPEAREDGARKASVKTDGERSVTSLQREVLGLQQTIGNNGTTRVLARRETDSGVASEASEAVPTDSSPALAAMWRTGVSDHLEAARAVLDKPRPQRADFLKAKEELTLVQTTVRGLHDTYKTSDKGLADNLAALYNGTAGVRNQVRARLGEFMDSTELVMSIEINQRRAGEISGLLH